MNSLVRDFKTHPLTSGSVLAVIMGDPASRRAHPLEPDGLLLFNKQNTVEVIEYFQNLGIVDPGRAERLLAVDGAYVACFRSLMGKFDELSDVTGCARKPLQSLARALISAKLMSEYLEILTPPELSYEKTAQGTVDLLESLFDAFRRIVGGAWSVFFPRTEFNLLTDASAHFWVSCLYSSRPEEIAGTFPGYFRRDFRDRFAALNKPAAAARALHVKDAISEYLDNSREKVGKLHEVVAPAVREGLDRSFQEITRVIGKLDLPALVATYYENLVQDVLESFSALDGSVSPKESRFNQYLLAQINHLCREFQISSRQSSPQVRQEELSEVLRELDELIGIADVKTKVRELANFAKIQQVRVAQGLKLIPASYHTVYTGNPGTGKTTVARLMGRIFKSLGMLRKGHLVECDRSALVAEYVGQTAVKTNAVIDSARDGILFIDEAYSLVKEHEDFGQEAIETLLKRMEDERERLIVIVAGYPVEMAGFIHSNPGLHSRFARFIEFPDYNPTELCRIFSLQCRRSGLALTPGLREKLVHYFHQEHSKRGGNFGNARLVRNLFEGVINSQASRLAGAAELDAKALSWLDADDLAAVESRAIESYRSTRAGYVVRCPHCQQIYSWLPEAGLREAQCGHCGKNYDAEFGETPEAK
ncbi:MAG: AAA family ATPase [Verrucomicrobia bacterium]|nr:AAA family ATPase [Verrucomicrobiota bacterium]MBI3869229.1 AAA family ATPase [Verrucomicrobiota bacterium]